MRKARILCMVIIVVMLAQPVVAALSVAVGCDGDCCCCQAPDRDESLNIRALPTTASDCCGSDDPAAACRMSSTDRPDTQPALIRSAAQTQVDANQMTPAALHAAVHRPSTSLDVAWTDTGPQSPSVPLYLRTCRLIC